MLTDFAVAPYVDCITTPYTPTFDEGVAVSSVSSIVGSASDTVICASNVYSTDGRCEILVAPR